SGIRFRKPARRRRKKDGRGRKALPSARRTCKPGARAPGVPDLFRTKAWPPIAFGGAPGHFLALASSAFLPAGCPPSPALAIVLLVQSSKLEAMVPKATLSARAPSASSFD